MRSIRPVWVAICLAAASPAIAATASFEVLHIFAAVVDAFRRSGLNSGSRA